MTHLAFPVVTEAPVHLISWRNVHVLKMEREKDAEGFKEDLGQKVLD